MAIDVRHGAAGTQVLGGAASGQAKREQQEKQVEGTEILRRAKVKGEREFAEKNQLENQLFQLDKIDYARESAVQEAGEIITEKHKRIRQTYRDTDIAIAEDVRKGHMTESEAKQAREANNARMAGVKGFKPDPDEKVPTAQELFDKNIVTRGGKEYFYNPETKKLDPLESPDQAGLDPEKQIKLAIQLTPNVMNADGEDTGVIDFAAFDENMKRIQKYNFGFGSSGGGTGNAQTASGTMAVGSPGSEMTGGTTPTAAAPIPPRADVAPIERKEGDPGALQTELPKSESLKNIIQKKAVKVMSEKQRDANAEADNKKRKDDIQKRNLQNRIKSEIGKIFVPETFSPEMIGNLESVKKEMDQDKRITEGMKKKVKRLHYVWQKLKKKRGLNRPNVSEKDKSDHRKAVQAAFEEYKAYIDAMGDLENENTLQALKYTM